MRVQIYVDVLRSIDSISSSEKPVTLYRLEHLSSLTYGRLRRALSELQVAGFIDGRLRVTDAGYEFLDDISVRVLPILRKYGLWER